MRTIKQILISILFIVLLTHTCSCSYLDNDWYQYELIVYYNDIEKPARLTTKSISDPRLSRQGCLEVSDGFYYGVIACSVRTFTINRKIKINH